MRKLLLFAIVTALTVISASADIVGYDSRTGADVNFTSGTPRTFMGQGFSLGDGGSSPQITSMNIVMVAGAALNYVDTQIRVQFWDVFSSATSPVFSNPVGGVQTLATGPISTGTATAYTFTLNFPTPIALTGLTGHGLTVNWQGDPTGTGTFANDNNLTAGLRTAGSADIVVGTNTNPSSGYYRNASGGTDFNFLSTDSRTLSGVTNGGLVFDLTVVPEPSALVLSGLAGLALLARRRRTA
jgi:hypothetical protein